MAENILPPFPDELLEARLLEQVIAFINGLELPGRVGRFHLGRWAKVTGATVTAREYGAVSSKPGGRRRPVFVEVPTPLTRIQTLEILFGRVRLAVDALRLAGAIARIAAEELAEESEGEV